MRYIRLVIMFFKATLQNEMAYRFNFIINILNSVLGLAAGIGGIYILYANKETLNGWSFLETLALLGVYMTVQASKALVFGPSFNKLAGMGGEIETGTFDNTLLRPIPVQFHISVRSWSIWAVFDFIIGIGITITAATQLGIKYSILDVAAFVISLAISLAIIYSVMLFLSSVAFWYRGTFLLWILDDILQTGRYPVGIYPGFIKLILTWVIPVGFIVTVPAEILTGKSSYVMPACGVALAAVLFVAASVFFRRSLNKYTSASS